MRPQLVTLGLQRCVLIAAVVSRFSRVKFQHFGPGFSDSHDQVFPVFIGSTPERLPFLFGTTCRFAFWFLTFLLPCCAFCVALRWDFENGMLRNRAARECLTVRRSELTLAPCDPNQASQVGAGERTREADMPAQV